MATKSDNFPETKYQLNEHQWMVVKKGPIREALQNLTFPILVLDLEFFNRSHNTKQLRSQWCDLASGQSYVYLLQFAILRDLQSLIQTNTAKAIKHLTIKRGWKEPNYSFLAKYEILIKDFIAILIKNRIKTIVVAGASNDKQIINDWLKNHEKQFANKALKVEFWDIYLTLEQTMSFANTTAQGEVFWPPNNLKTGFSGPGSVSLPSLKKFFDYMRESFPNFTYNDSFDIYQLSHQILELFCRRRLSLRDYQKGVLAYQNAEKHCFNDVYKLVTLLKYWTNLVSN